MTYYRDRDIVGESVSTLGAIIYLVIIGIILAIVAIVIYVAFVIGVIAFTIAVISTLGIVLYGYVKAWWSSGGIPERSAGSFLLFFTTLIFMILAFFGSLSNLSFIPNHLNLLGGFKDFNYNLTFFITGTGSLILCVAALGIISQVFSLRRIESESAYLSYFRGPYWVQQRRSVISGLRRIPQAIASIWRFASGLWWVISLAGIVALLVSVPLAIYMLILGTLFAAISGTLLLGVLAPIEIATWGIWKAFKGGAMKGKGETCGCGKIHPMTGPGIHGLLSRKCKCGARISIWVPKNIVNLELPTQMWTQIPLQPGSKPALAVGLIWLCLAWSAPSWLPEVLPVTTTDMIVVKTPEQLEKDSASSKKGRSNSTRKGRGQQKGDLLEGGGGDPFQPRDDKKGKPSSRPPLQKEGDPFHPREE